MAREEGGAAASKELPATEALKRLIDKARRDPAFFHGLVFEPEKALAGVDFLGRREKGAIVGIRPEDVIAGLAGLITGPGGAAAVCGHSCEDSCDSTCGAGSCFGTCMSSSCDHTCGSRSCDVTVEIMSRFDMVSQPMRNRGFFRPMRRG